MKQQLARFMKAAIWVAITAFVLRCMLSYKEIMNGISPYSLYGFAGEAVGFTAFLMVLYERFLWRYLPCQTVPVLSKVYTGTIKSVYGNVERKATLKIKQSLLYVHVTLVTDESKSTSISASIDEILDEMQLTYCFLNTPKTAVRHRSELHYGTAMLCVESPQKLTGTYYTDRNTSGDMVFTAE